MVSGIRSVFFPSHISKDEARIAGLGSEQQWKQYRCQGQLELAARHPSTNAATQKSQPSRMRSGLGFRDSEWNGYLMGFGFVSRRSLHILRPGPPAYKNRYTTYIYIYIYIYI